MSHVTTIDLEIHDLEALKVAAADCGCELRLGQATYRWYGKHMGDYPLPAGFTQDDIGNCEHAICRSDKHDAYEIGVVKSRAGEGWTLLYDFWAGGKGMSEAVGDKCERLKQAYAAEVARKQLRKKGFAVKKKRNDAGEYVLVGSRM